MSNLMVIMVRMGGREEVLSTETSPFAECYDESRGVVSRRWGRGHDGEGVKRSLTATVNLINVSRDSPLSGSSRDYLSTLAYLYYGCLVRNKTAYHTMI